MGAKNAKQAMKIDAEKKQELEQKLDDGPETPHVEQGRSDDGAVTKVIESANKKMSATREGDEAPSQMVVPEGSESILDHDSTLQQRYGIDIVYVPEINEFAMKKYEFDPENGEYDTKFVFIEDRDLSQDAWNDEHLSKMMRIFSDDTQIESTEIDLYDTLKQYENLNENASLSCAYYDFENNIINVNYYNIPEGKHDECVAMFMKQYHFTKEQAEQTIGILTSRDPTVRMSQFEHEATHEEQNKKYATFQYDLPPEYIAKLDMMGEIHASMVQAGYALDFYEATGDLQHFDNLALSHDSIGELKKNIAKNPDMEDRREYVAKFIHDKWLEDNNRDGSGYSQQAYIFATPRFRDYPLWALADNQEAQNKYHERIDAMFENVIGFGDVRKIVNPDFKLNENLQARLAWDNPMDNELLRAIMTKDAHNASQYIANLQAYFDKLREFDADGVRTPEELAKLDAYLQEIIPETQETPNNDAPDVAVTVAMKQRGNQGR